MNIIISKIKTSIITISIFFFAMCSLSSCSLSYRIDTLDQYDICYSNKNAFIGYVTYNLDTTDIYLPSEYNGVKVEELGGYYGRGVPTPFFLGYSGIEYGFSIKLNDINDEATIIETKINIYLPKYLKKCAYIEQIVSGVTINDHDIVYVARCNYYIDSENEYFYTNNGKLYNKSDNTLVENLIYQD